MAEQMYTTRQATEGVLFYNTLKSVPAYKRDIAALMAEAFINGMNAQERLSGQRDRPA